MLLYMLRWALFFIDASWHPLTLTKSMMPLDFEYRIYTSRNTEEWVGSGTGWVHMVAVVARSIKTLVDTGLTI